MTRIFWTPDELDDLASLNWIQFKAKYPYRTYDSYEVKRRRIASGSAGTKVPNVLLVERELASKLAEDVLNAVDRWVAEVGRSVG